MIWAFERRGEQISCEVRREAEGDSFELVVSYPDGSERVERFDDPTALIDSSVQCLERFRREGWKPIQAQAAFPI